MTDIVERLRTAPSWELLTVAADEAADEIVRLREELRILYAAMVRIGGPHFQLRHEEVTG